MPRLLDRMFGGWTVPAGSRLHPGLLQSERDVLDASERVIFDNVNRFYWQNLKNYPAGGPAEMFPNLAPPYEILFLETRKPPIVGIDGRDEPWPRTEPLAWGVLCHWTDISDRPFPVEDTPDGRRFGERLTALAPAARWILEATLYLENEKSSVTGPHLIARYPILADGSPTQEIDSYAKLVIGKGPVLNPIVQRHGEELGLYLNPALLAISFMHCRNVSLREYAPAPAVSRKYEKRTRRALEKFKILDIEPAREILRREGRVEAEGIQRALHLCRGHFKDYRQRGLFGRHKGLYWFPDHARGDVDAGIVSKDYRVHPDKRDGDRPNT